MSKAQSELAELIGAARDFMIHVYAQAPKKDLQGRTAVSLFMELYDLTPDQAEAQSKAVPAGAPSVRLAQAIKAATVADDSQAEIGRLRGALEFYADQRVWVGQVQPRADSRPVVRDGGKVAREALKGAKPPRFAMTTFAEAKHFIPFHPYRLSDCEGAVYDAKGKRQRIFFRNPSTKRGEPGHWVECDIDGVEI